MEYLKECCHRRPDLWSIGRLKNGRYTITVWFECSLCGDVPLKDASNEEDARKIWNEHKQGE